MSTKLILAVVLLGLLSAVGYRLVKFGDDRATVRYNAAMMKAAEESKQKVERVKQEEKAKYDEKIRAHKEEEQAEREAQQKRAEEDHRKMLDLDRRYKKSLAEDQSCSTWVNSAVPCPLE